MGSIDLNYSLVSNKSLS